jgi:hypothetical protein
VIATRRTSHPSPTTALRGGGTRADGRRVGGSLAPPPPPQGPASVQQALVRDVRVRSISAVPNMIFGHLIGHIELESTWSVKQMIYRRFKAIDGIFPLLAALRWLRTALGSIYPPAGGPMSRLEKVRCALPCPALPCPALPRVVNPTIKRNSR